MMLFTDDYRIADSLAGMYVIIEADDYERVYRISRNKPFTYKFREFFPVVDDYTTAKDLIDAINKRLSKIQLAKDLCDMYAKDLYNFSNIIDSLNIDNFFSIRIYRGTISTFTLQPVLRTVYETIN